MKVADYGKDDYNEWADALAQYLADNMNYTHNYPAKHIYELIREFQESLI